MTTGPGELALQHLERLKGELRTDLEAVEGKIAELEAESVVRKSRIDSLAEVLSSLVDSVEQFQEIDESESEENGAFSEMVTTKKRLMGVLHEVRKEAKTASEPVSLTELYGNYRSRLMTMLNALDLALVALRNKEARQEQKEAEQDAEGETDATAHYRATLGSSAIIRSQEVERQRIAREIHDGPAQAIANVVLRMDIISKLYEKDPERVRDELARMKAIAQGALDEIRGFIFDLRPMTLQDLGLVATIRRVVSSVRDLTGMNLRFIVEGEEQPLGQLISLAVFRIAQEAITNLKKYAQAETAWVHLKYLEDKVILIVEDDGKGFDLSEVAKNQKKFVSFGLLGMRERADDINASLEITSVVGEGTKVVLVVPTRGNPALNMCWDDDMGRSAIERRAQRLAEEESSDS